MKAKEFDPGRSLISATKDFSQESKKIGGVEVEKTPENYRAVHLVNQQAPASDEPAPELLIEIPRRFPPSMRASRRRR